MMPPGWNLDLIHCLAEDSLYFKGGTEGVFVSVQGRSKELQVEWGRYKDAYFGRPTEGTLRRDGSVALEKGQSPFSLNKSLTDIFQRAEALYGLPWDEVRTKRMGRMLRPSLTPEQLEEKKSIALKEQLAQKYRIREVDRMSRRWSGVQVVEYWPGGYVDLIAEYISESDKAVLLKIPWQGGQAMKWFPKSQIARRKSQPDGSIWASIWIMKKLGLLSPTGRRL